MSAPKKHTGNVSRRRLIKTAIFGGVGATAAFQYFEADSLRVDRHDLYLNRWDADGFKLALLSDLHANKQNELKRALRALELARAEKPDLLCLAGDFLNVSTDQALKNVDRFLDACEDTGIRTLAILGNHDYWVSTTPRLILLFGGRKSKLLRNESIRIGDVTVWGIDDGIAGRDNHELPSRHSDDPSLLALFHEPDFVDRIDQRVGLMLAGHSHGGQMCLPFGYALHTPRGAWRYTAGFYADAKVPLYVTRGVGTVGLPFRLFCPPEVSILTLRGGATS